MDPSDPTIDLGLPVPVWIEPLPLHRLEPGRWYLGWRCRRCRNVVAVENDPTCGAIRIRLGGRGVVYFTCRACGSAEVQSGAECLQYQRASDASQRHRVVDQHTGTDPVAWGPRMTLAERKLWRVG